MRKQPKPEGQCSICGGNYSGFGHNPSPVKAYEERCCEACNYDIVVPIRMFGINAGSAIRRLRECGFAIRVMKNSDTQITKRTRTPSKTPGYGGVK